MEWQNDGWDCATRIGVLIPHADVGPESEIRAMAPADVAIHGSRALFRAMAVGGTMDPTIAQEPVRAFAEPPHIDDATELLAAAPIHVIAFGFTSSAYVIGPEAEQGMVDRLRQRAHGLPVVTPCAGTINALQVLNKARIAHVSPPWFDAELDAAGRRYYESSGLEVVYSSPCNLPSEQTRIRPQTLYDWVVQNIPDSAEAIVIGGNGFRAVGAIEALEATLERPVLTANQVLLWAALKAVSYPTRSISHYGQIFKT